MSVLEAVVLGLVQGLTEFLPISSSGHLVVVPAMAGWSEPSLTFDLVLHVGTLIAVIGVYRSDLVMIMRGVLGRGHDPDAARKLALLLVVGTLPAAVLGLVLESVFERLFGEPYWVCGELMLTAAILFGAEWWVDRRAAVEPHATDASVEVRSAALIGAAQAVAIAPGISRSGATIAAGLGLGVARADAARFSFLLSIPAIAGAAMTKVPDVASGDFKLTWAVFIGFCVSGVSGYLAITGFLRYLRHHSLRVFASYLVVFAPVAALVIAARG